VRNTRQRNFISAHLSMLYLFTQIRTEALSMTPLVINRTMSIGAETISGGGVHFRIWAPDHSSVSVIVEGKPSAVMERESDGYWSRLVEVAAPGDRYKFQLDGGEAYPDPASRFQPEGSHGSSQIVDPAAYQWSAEESSWMGRPIEGQVLYELHIGTFTPEGTYEAAERELGRLADLGITMLEIMPLGQFSGRWGWGYDGVDIFAPHNTYGTPEELRHFIDAAHRKGLAVILDVVYNHAGPDGNYLKTFSTGYFSKQDTDWGAAFNFNGPHCRPVRDFCEANAAYWIREFHFDGLRLDATQSIQDSCCMGKHILEQIGVLAREAAGKRNIIIVAENEPQNTTLIRPIHEGGYGLDGLWNDDLHHSMVVRLTLKREAYYSDHLGVAQEFVSAAKFGFLYQGQHYAWQKGARGSSALGIEPQHFVTFLENHDQVANTATGSRLRTRSHPGVYRAMTAYWLLAPGTPMFFQGQEYGAQSRFFYFSNHHEKLRQSIRQGREEFLRQFPSLQSEQSQRMLADPSAEETFQRSKLDPSEQSQYPQMVALHADLLTLRRTDPVISRRQYQGLDGAVLSNDCFVLRYFAEEEQDRLLVVNFGCDLDLPHSPEPLLAPCRGCMWNLGWSSDDPRYGGGGVVAPMTESGWRIPGASTILLTPVPFVATL
jgi:maltooligosyltrehalose trehalohydrolase